MNVLSFARSSVALRCAALQGPGQSPVNLSSAPIRALRAGSGWGVDGVRGARWVDGYRVEH